ncbi:MAG: hypothetical protein JWO70_324 [Betaproteobacteria bacterium]|nr:hypothetical protein [Betaproteobacteria bacterium]
MSDSVEANTEEIERQVCPMHALSASRPGLDQDDELFFPHHKRVITQYSTDAQGAPELHLYYGDKEISFDEPELFAFGEGLGRQARFAAGAATRWGEGYEWPRVRELLEQLLEGGILQYAETAEAGPVTMRDGARPSPLPQAVTAAARTWDECAAITRELTGHALEPGYLELVVPIFRVAHMALDAEGRQVGEANVFPKPLRLDVPTKWRTCIYAGSRFQEERPMNVTALKTMRAHWPQMMEALRRIREAYLARFPAARNGWTVGDLERLSTLVLAVPTYMLVRTQGRVENGKLHPALSSMFRVSDGLRMTTHQMLFVPVGEATLAPDALITSREVYEYAERNYAFHSTHGVCAGPRVMIEEFLGVLVDGRGARDDEAAVLDPPVEDALRSIDRAFDYGLYGLQAHAVVFSLWPVMTRTYERLSRIADEWQGPSDAVAALREHLHRRMETLRNESLHATEEWRVNRERVYAHIYEASANGLGVTSGETLEERLSPVDGAAHAQVASRLRAILSSRLGGGAADAGVESIVACLASYFVRAKAILVLACEIQNRINALVGRAAPSRPFNAKDVDIHVLLQGDEARRLPYLINELEPLLGLRVEITKDVIEITESITT